MEKTLVLPNDTATVPELATFIEEVCENASLDMGVTMQLNLAVEEAVVNVMSYAYPEGTEGFVEIKATTGEGSIIFTITDSGAPFDPTAKEEADTTLEAEDRPIGGLGIHLVRQIMDSIAYERTAKGQNVLTLTKWTA